MKKYYDIDAGDGGSMRNITDLGSFAVKNDGSEDFKKFILEPLNEWQDDRKLIDCEGFFGVKQATNTFPYFWVETQNIPILSVQQVKDYLLSGVRPGEEKYLDEPKDTLQLEEIIALLSTKFGLIEYKWEEGVKPNQRILNYLNERLSISTSAWIDVKERLPENDSEVLVWREHFTNSPICAYYVVGSGKWHGSHETTDCMIDGYVNKRELSDKPTHWMLLPEPPKPLTP